MCKGLATLPATCLKSAKDIKHKISFLLQKPEPQAAHQRQMKEKTLAADTKRVPTAAEVEKWKSSFSHLMSSESGRQIFAGFLKSEFSEENMDFWVACEEYKKSAVSELATRAKQVCQEYVETDAPREVNLDAVTREETLQKVEQNACLSCFDAAQNMIYKLMEKDSYRRFLHSKPIQDLCNAAATLEKKDKRHCHSAKTRQMLAGGA